MEKKKQESPQEVEGGAKGKISSEDYFADFNFSDLKVDMGLLLKNGAHFGHKKSRRHPKMDIYIHTTRNEISIIDLQSTLEKLKEALEFIGKAKEEGKQILFVGTKKQAKDLIISAAKRCGAPFVVERWLGGTFTNFKIIKERAKYLTDNQGMFQRGEFEKYTKFERMKKLEEMEKMEKKMGGIKNMGELPGVVFAVDIKEDILAIKEARKLNIPVVAIADTNTDPSLVDYPIPANDDAISSLRIILACVCKSILEAKPNIKSK